MQTLTTAAAGRNEAVVREEIGALLKELHPQARRLPPVHLQSGLAAELGLDSLARMELLARLEDRFGVVLPADAAATVTTPGDLLQALLGASPRTEPAPAAEPARAAATFEPPLEAATVIDVLAWHASRHPARVHVRFVEGDLPPARSALTYGALQAAASEAGAALQARGLRPGEPVALMYPTEPDLLIAFFAVLLAGGVPVPLYPPLQPRDFADYWRRQSGILRNCQARWMLVGERLHAHRHALGALAGSVERLLTVAQLREQPRAVLEPVPARAGDLALLQYTSGSTADPKGVMLSHANLLANLRAMGEVVAVAASDIFVSWLPLYHDMGLIGAWLGSLYFGIPLVLMPPQAFLLRPERWLWAIHRHGATLSAAPNFAYELCLQRVPPAALEGLDLSRLRLVFCGAEPVLPDTMARFAERFAAHGLRREALFPVYGLAENALGLTFPPPGRGVQVLAIDRDRFLAQGDATPAGGDAPALKVVSCGRALPGHEIRLADAAGRELPDGRQGRIQFRGPSATRGYYRNPAEDRALFQDGWLDTGDLGFVFAGELYLTGRAKDLIIRAGQHLHPQVIEQAVGQVAGVRRGRVVAFGSRQRGTERLVIVAETRLTGTAERDALRAAVGAAVQACVGEPADELVLAPPGAVLKTSSGKLRRAACLAAYDAGRLGTPQRARWLGLIARSARDRLARTLRRARELGYAAWVWSLVGVLAVPGMLALALPGLPRRWRALQGLLRALAVLSGVRLRRRIGVPVPAQPCMFVANHASNIDALVLLWALPRPVAIATKVELAHIAPLRWALRRIEVAFVDRADPRQCTAVVQEARAGQRDFLFFPEGTFRRTAGLLPFHLGAFLAAAEAGMPVVPVALEGTRAVLRDDEHVPRRGPITVTVGAPLPPATGADAWHRALALSAAARAWLLAHAGEPDAGEG